MSKFTNLADTKYVLQDSKQPLTLLS